VLNRRRSARLDPLDSDAAPLWDMWYMGSTPFPAELLNPAPRATVLGALAYPHLYARAAAATTSGEKTQSSGKVKLADLPDTAIVFRRYLDAGRMVNVHDWFESFKLVLEDQRSDDAAEVSFLLSARLCSLV
jgi:origin recognition complex subunit 3